MIGKKVVGKYFGCFIVHNTIKHPGIFEVYRAKDLLINNMNAAVITAQPSIELCKEVIRSF